MTDNSRFKRAVRDHRAATGKSYAQARRDLLSARENGEPRKVTWDTLAELEPRLLELEAEIQQVADDPADPRFCANAAWERGGFRDTLVSLVGWHRGEVNVDEDAGKPPGEALRLYSRDDLARKWLATNELVQARKQREEAAGLGVLWTSSAYEVATDRLYGYLPPCRNCVCL